MAALGILESFGYKLPLIHAEALSVVPVCLIKRPAGSGLDRAVTLAG